MIRLLALLVLLSVACRWIFGKWPWEYLQARPAQRPGLARARRLLGVAAGAGPGEIREAHRRMTARIHPDRGGNHADMQDLNAARDILLQDLSQQPEHPE